MLGNRIHGKQESQCQQHQAGNSANYRDQEDPESPDQSFSYQSRLPPVLCSFYPAPGTGRIVLSVSTESPGIFTAISRINSAMNTNR